MKLSAFPLRPFAVFALGLASSGLVASGALLGACGGDSAAEEGEEAGPVDASRRDGSSFDGGVDPESDGGAKLPSDVASCEALKSFYEACGGEPLCSTKNAKFDEWCVANTRSVDSEAYRLATVKCATADNCGKDKRKDCMYRSYGDTTQSVAQELLTTAFCQMCQPGDLAGCRKRTTTYNSVSGPGAVPSEFIAAWELSDAVADKIRANCTGTGGGAFDGGADAGACATAFDRCSGGYFIDAILDCP